MSIVIWPELPPAWVNEIRGAAGATPLVTPASEAEALRAAADATAWIGELPPAMFAAGKKLQWFQAWRTGLETLVYPELLRSSITLTNMRHIYDDHVANYVMAVFLALCRDLSRFIHRGVKHEWTPRERDTKVVIEHRSDPNRIDIRDPAKMTVAILGVGGIGAEVAHRMSVLGPTIIGIDPKVSGAPPGVSEMVKPDRLPEILARADAVVIAAPQTPQTTGLFDEALLRKMQPHAFLINVGRGKIVKLAALERAITEGWIAGAALDVFEVEPLPADSKLWDMERVIITPHTGGEPHAEYREVETAVKNVRRFVAGETLMNVVDKAQWF